MIRRRKVSRKEGWVPGALPFVWIGIIYYLISPPFVIHFLSDDNDLLYAATRYLDSRYFDLGYFLDVVIILVSFLLGYFLATIITNTKSSVLDYGSFQTRASLLLAISFCMLIGYFTVTANSSGTGFFTGYSTYNIQILGPFSTCAFLSAWFVNYFSNKQIRLLFLSLFIVCSALLLGWGSRMFFVLGFLALMLGLVAKDEKLLKSLRFYSFIIISCLLLIVVGIVREGGRDFSADNLVAVLFAEPLFTSITGALYLENSGGRPVYAVPHDLVASIIHFIPSAVYPGKMELIARIAPNDDVQSPFGARALIVNLYSNFGFFYPIFVTFIGFYYGFLYKKARNSVFFRATYFSSLPILLLLFFRENLITVIKVMFFNGLAVPLFVSLLLIWSSPRTLADIRSRISHNRLLGDFASRSRSTSTTRFLRP